ncbi:CP2 transcription factor-domain-containing protein [Absidia repens]|uniref:CP2 transcription factor-domain-containing protein n=1 Tax=Absidia repens TaxID=90262 RepID=A0A1X2HKH4_9FUNG|nr:CP2 transcription factor-domain-containing protein [Absidia repens]
MCQQEATTVFEYWQHHRQQLQNGFQDLSRLASESSPPHLPPPLAIPITSTVNAIADQGPRDYQYQQRQQPSSTASVWALAHSPVIPLSTQQDTTLINQSFYSAFTTQQNFTHLRQSPIATSSTTISPSSKLETTGELVTYPHQQQDQQKRSRFHTVLQAMTAVTQKTELSLTYLNRNQTYGIQLVDKLGNDGLIESQFTITFHDPAHQKVAPSFWKFWIGQHNDPENARSVDLDPSQSIGISNVRYPSFDRIIFDWHGRHGAKLFVRFHCLSTDFSRIKGVKGIPLRACMSSQISMVNHDPLFQRNYAGSFHPNDMYESEMNYIEKSFCKVKLFRDKGAERKYKDDAKQLGKQFEKIVHDGDARKHPMWLMYNQSVPYTIFNELSTVVNEASPTTLSNEKTSDIKQPHHAKCKLKQQQSTMSHYQRHLHHYHPYIKQSTTASTSSSIEIFTPAPLASSSGTVMVPTQLYSGGRASSIPSSASLSPPSSILDNNNGCPTAVPNQKKCSSLMSLEDPDRSKDMIYRNQLSSYAYHQYRFSPAPSSSPDSYHLTD